MLISLFTKSQLPNVFLITGFLLNSLLLVKLHLLGVRGLNTESPAYHRTTQKIPSALLQYSKLTINFILLHIGIRLLATICVQKAYALKAFKQKLPILKWNQKSSRYPEMLNEQLHGQEPQQVSRALFRVLCARKSLKAMKL